MATVKSPAVRTRSPLRRLLRAVIVFTAVPYFGVLILLAVLQRSLMYGPTLDNSLNQRPAHISGARVEPVQLTTSGSLTLNGWHITANSATDQLAANGPEWTHGRPLILIEMTAAFDAQ